MVVQIFDRDLLSTAPNRQIDPIQTPCLVLLLLLLLLQLLVVVVALLPFCAIIEIFALEHVFFFFGGALVLCVLCDFVCLTPVKK